MRTSSGSTPLTFIVGTARPRAAPFELPPINFGRIGSESIVEGFTDAKGIPADRATPLSREALIAHPDAPHTPDAHADPDASPTRLAAFAGSTAPGTWLVEVRALHAPSHSGASEHLPPEHLPPEELAPLEAARAPGRPASAAVGRPTPLRRKE
ncbi:hypothetical protein [Streptomyces radicis]|uniref:hypothetical protein n=1 Tax=Streptomyces radicis TaxID=1750517 RepID=UPI0016049278|nr:hypothetical protein [Streptomyces radicis]